MFKIFSPENQEKAEERSKARVKRRMEVKTEILPKIELGIGPTTSPKDALKALESEFPALINRLRRQHGSSSDLDLYRRARAKLKPMEDKARALTSTDEAGNPDEGLLHMNLRRIYENETDY